MWHFYAVLTTVLMSMHYMQSCAGSRIPKSELLCSFIVDSSFENQCLDCFANAGDLKQHPSKVRHCVATFLPPKMAVCVVPHARKKPNKPSMTDELPDVHHNHMNANLLPGCLHRTIKHLKKYQENEFKFMDATCKLLDRVTNRDKQVIMNGDEYILQIAALRQVIEDIQVELEITDISCDENILLEIRKNNPRKSFGNKFPGDGIGPISKELINGECLIHTLLSKGYGSQLLKLFKSDDAFSPIPTSWSIPLLSFAKHQA